MDQSTHNLPPIPRPPPPFSSSSRNANLTGVSSPSQNQPPSFSREGSIQSRIDSFQSQPKSPSVQSTSNSITSVASSPPTFSHQRGSSLPSGTVSTFNRTNSHLAQLQSSSSSLQPSTSGSDLNLDECSTPFADDKSPNPSQEDLDKWARFRKNIAGEILSTEVTYVKSLKQMFEVYHDPYERGERNTGMSVKKIETLFKLVRIILNVAESFLQSLEPLVQKWDEKEEIASIFLQYHPMFKTYKDFAAAHQQKILPVLNRLSEKNNFLTYQDKVLKTIPGCLDLASYLIMPIQRLPRYKLLLESLISYTPRNHPDAQNLVLALKHISTVATAVNDAMKEAQNVQHYIEIQTMFQVNDLVHLWRKLVCEVDSKISRVWLPSTPRDDKKSDKEKREKRHRFVGLDCRIYVFTDCVFIGVKTKEREALLEKAKLNKSIYPIYGDGYSFKFSVLTMFIHDLQQNVTVNEHTYHNSLIVGGPTHAVALNFPDEQSKSQCLQQLLSTQTAFEQLSRKRTMSSTDGAFRDPTSSSHVLCCDHSSHALFELKTMGNMKLFIPHHEHFICGQSNDIVSATCLDESYHNNPTASRAHSRLGNRLHTGYGYGVLPNPTSSPRVSKMYTLSPAGPSPRHRGNSPSRKGTVSKSISGFTHGGSGSRLSSGSSAANHHGEINAHTGAMLGMSLSDLQSIRLHSVNGGSNITGSSSRHINTVFEGGVGGGHTNHSPTNESQGDDDMGQLQTIQSDLSTISSTSTTLPLPVITPNTQPLHTSIPQPPLTTPASLAPTSTTTPPPPPPTSTVSPSSSIPAPPPMSTTSSIPVPPPFSPPTSRGSTVQPPPPPPSSTTSAPPPSTAPPPFPAQLSNPSFSILIPPQSTTAPSGTPPPPPDSPTSVVSQQIPQQPQQPLPPGPPQQETPPPAPPSVPPSFSQQSSVPPPTSRPMSCGSLASSPSSPSVPATTRSTSAVQVLDRRLPLYKPSIDDDVPPPPPPDALLSDIPESSSPVIRPSSTSNTTPESNRSNTTTTTVSSPSIGIAKASSPSPAPPNSTRSAFRAPVTQPKLQSLDLSKRPE